MIPIPSSSSSPGTPRNRKPKFDLEIAHFTERQLSAIHLLDSGLIKFLLYGGAVGGGKSYFLRWYLVRRLMLLYSHFKIPSAMVMLACEDYPSLKDRQLSKIGLEFPPWLGVLREDDRRYGRAFILREKYGGGVMAFRNLDDPSKYASAEFAAIGVDELTKNLYDTFNHLRTRLRWPGLQDIECQFLGGTNPGSVGHGWVKQLWIDRSFPPEFMSPRDYSPQFAFVPSKADDNPHLDASYWAMLETLPTQLRAAFRHGDWNIFVGQAFPEFGPWSPHVIDPLPVPEWASVIQTFDWGYGAPFSVGWWWIDTQGRFFRFAEWYGYDGTPNSGLRLPDSDIAEGILEREERLGINKRGIIRILSPDCYSKRPNYQGKGQGPSTAEVFARYGIIGHPGDPDRKLKIRQFRERLKVPRVPEGKDPELPMLCCYRTCEQFIRTIPVLVTDKLDPEEINTQGEDHCYDEAALLCMARPLIQVPVKAPEVRKAPTLDDLARFDREEAWKEAELKESHDLDMW